MPCKVCGDPRTVNSHLIPRSFIHSIKGGHQTALVGFANAAGYKHTQSGEFDPDLLCDTHEQALADCDRYAFEWVRDFGKNAVLRNDLDGNLFEVRNPKPHLMLQFISSILWRHALSDRMAGSGIDVGPWETSLRNLIFRGASYNPDICIAKRDLTIGGVILDPPLIMIPHEKQIWGRRGWAFEIGSFIWSIKLDDRSKGRMPLGLTANDRDPILVWNFDPLPAIERTGLIDTIGRMHEPRKYHRGG